MSGENHKLLDKRVVDRYRDKGLVTEVQYAAHMKNLPDESANAVWVNMELHDTELNEPVDKDLDEES